MTRVKGFEDGLKEALLTKGPMTVSVDAGAESFRFYKRGIYNNTACHTVPVTGMFSAPERCTSVCLGLYLAAYSHGDASSSACSSLSAESVQPSHLHDGPIVRCSLRLRPGPRRPCERLRDAGRPGLLDRQVRCCCAAILKVRSPHCMR